MSTARATSMQQEPDRRRRQRVLQNALFLTALAFVVYGGFILLVHWRGGI